MQTQMQNYMQKRMPNTIGPKCFLMNSVHRAEALREK